MKRAHFALLPLAGLLLCACQQEGAPPAGGGAPPPPAETPVIVYLIDTLRADRLGLYGYDQPTSPRLDALAAESVVFEAAYAAAPWTLPSVASLMTSTWPCEHGLARHNQRLNPQWRTLAEALQARGYATGGYYQNAIIGPVTGLDRGFQLSELHAEATRSFLPEARRFLDQTAGRPFLLYLHTMEPHNIEQVPPRYLRPFGHVSVDDREAFTAHWDGLSMSIHLDRKVGTPLGTMDSERDVRHAMASLAAMRESVRRLYDAAVLHANDNLGEVIDLLRERGLWDRVLFVVLADHGESFGDHGTWFHEHSVYEELIRVPLIVHFPRGEFGGRRIREIVSLLDLKPTILDWLGDTAGCAGCRGRSLLPLLRGEAPSGGEATEVVAMRMNRTAYFPPFKALRGDDNVALRDGPWKGIWNVEPQRLELYNLAADPGETRDRSSEERERTGRLAEHARQWLGQCQAALAPPVEVPETEIDETTRQQLRALGYIR